MNAFILAGDRGRSRQVGGMNKAFLLLEGRPVLLYVLMALDRVRGIDQVYVVGPRKEIMGVIEKALPEVLFSKKIEVLEQKNSLLENILYGYTYSLPGYQEGIGAARLPHEDPPALFLPADIPLVTTAEIEEFIAGSDMKAYDYCLGVTEEKHLTPFYPRAGAPGIRMAYLYLKEKTYRMNNLHLARPFRVGAGSYIQKVYNHRYQKYAGNRLRMALEILRTPGCAKGLSFYLLAQGAVFFSKIKLDPLASFLRRFLTVEEVERQVSVFLKTRFKAVETGLGGAALDIDDEKTYKTMFLLFREWRAYLSKFDKSGGSFCPLKTGVCK